MPTIILSHFDSLEQGIFFHIGNTPLSSAGYTQNCNFASWDKPTNLRCPKCKSYLTVKEGKEYSLFKCSNKECDFEKKEETKQTENKE